MRVFISSVRRGLEAEREALAGLIEVLGHTPVRFEDFTAQPVPSREACARGVASADVYLLLMGEHYGQTMPETGQSPTHEEWTVATAQGLQRLVYLKNGILMDPDQRMFLDQISDYGSGIFRDHFDNVADLQIKVARKIKELAEAPGPLTFTPLDRPVDIAWRRDFASRLGSGHAEPAVEIHGSPTPAQALSARELLQIQDSLPERVRWTGLVPPTRSLEIVSAPDAVVAMPESVRVRWDDVRDWELIGVRVALGGQVSVWASMPSDRMGPVLDADALPRQIGRMLRLIGELRFITSPRLALAVGIYPTTSVSVGRVAQMPRSGATMLRSANDDAIHVSPDEGVSISALANGAEEMGAILARMVMAAAERG